MALAEIFLGLQHFGSLQMPDLGGEPFDRACHHGQRGEVSGVAVARHDLGGNRLDAEAELLRHIGFHLRIDMGEGADRAGDGAGGDLLAGLHQPFARAGELGVSHRELQAERGRLGMHAVASADGQRVLMLEGAGLQRGQQLVDIGNKDVGGLDQLHVEAGVEHVGGGEARVQEACFRADMLGDRGEEGDHVVLDLPLDRVDAGDVEAAAPLHGIGGMLRDLPELGHRLGGIGLDPEPDAEPGLGLPDAGHLGAAIAGDHRLRKGLSARDVREA